MVMQLETRKLLFRETGCANLEQYNEQFPEKRKRIIFACDEVAELLNKSRALQSREGTGLPD